ncbi:MAG: glycoside hydrolase family 127 protein [Acidimicrobiales bacterium]
MRIGPGFWADRQQLNGDVILDHCRGWMERLGWIANFSLASADARAGREFSDADVYKLVEAMAWEGARTGRRDLDEAVSRLAGIVAGAQQPDGYLNTMFGPRGPEGRYRDLEWGHELYCYGHLLQAAVARLRTGPAGGDGDDVLVAVARRAADHVCDVFGPDGRPAVDGHPVVEMALVELYRATGRSRYLEQARLFVERRGRPALADVEFGRAYFQDDMPVRAARAFRGHAVRALYLASGVVDVAVETGDQELLDIVGDQWARTVAARAYLTGGMGSRHQDEAFGDDYELPPERAYAETCAGVASVMLAWRLLLATGETRYADAIEQTLFNVVATAVAEDGRAFFYANPLQVRVPPAVPDPTVESPRAQAGLRAPWFTTACCPPNVARMLASLSAYVATTDRTGIQIHQLVPGEITAALAGGRSVQLRVSTDYPWSGRVTVHVEASPERPWVLAVRVPAWATGAVYRVSRAGDASGTRNEAAGVPTVPGYLAEDRVWRPGDELHLDLPVQPRWTYPDPRIDAVRSTVALERGPLVYCAEAVDTCRPAGAASGLVAPADTGRGGGLDVVVVDDSAEPVDLGADPALAGAVIVGVTAHDLQPAADAEAAYSSTPPDVGTGPARTLALIPYYSWANRGPAAMRVWLPRKWRPVLSPGR